MKLMACEILFTLSILSKDPDTINGMNKIKVSTGWKVFCASAGDPKNQMFLVAFRDGEDAVLRQRN